MKLKARVYSESPETNITKGTRLSHFYLHGKAEKLDGYDCCNANSEMFRKCLSIGIKLCTIESLDNKEHLALCFVYFSESKMNGRIILINDFDSLHEISNLINVNGLIEEGEKQYLIKNYPELYKQLK